MMEMKQVNCSWKVLAMAGVTHRRQVSRKRACKSDCYVRIGCSTKKNIL